MLPDNSAISTSSDIVDEEDDVEEEGDVEEIRVVEISSAIHNEKKDSKETNPQLLEQHCIERNETSHKRYKEFEFYCRLCESHIKNHDEIVPHIQRKIHGVFKQRKENRMLMVKTWNAAQPIVTDKMRHFLNNVLIRSKDEVDSFYEQCEPAIIDVIGIMQKRANDLAIQFFPFGSFLTRLMTIDSPMVDVFVKKLDEPALTIPETLTVLEKLEQKDISPFQSTFVGGYTARVKRKGVDIKFFFTSDPNAWNAVLSSKLLALYMVLCPKILQLAIIFRVWAKHVGFLKQTEERRVSGAVFDHMVVFFMQRYYSVPVIDQGMVKCSLDAFLMKPMDEQKAMLQRDFDHVHRRNNLPPAFELLQNLVLFYGCRFDYSHCIQIITKDSKQKEGRGLRSIKILDSMDSTVDLFSMLPDHASHLGNMLFVGAWDYLKPNNGYIWKLRTYQRRATGDKPVWRPCVFFDNWPSRIVKSPPDPFPTFTAVNGMTFWCPDFTTCPQYICSVCYGDHSERNCKDLKLVQIEDPVVAGVDEELTKFIMVYYERERMTTEHRVPVRKFIEDLEMGIFNSTGRYFVLKPFGSCISGFAVKNSDCDLCVHPGVDGDAEFDGIDLLCEIATILRPRFDLTEVYGANIPILKFVQKEGDGKIKGDISFSNLLPLKNTELMKQYADFDERVVPLVMSIRETFSVFGLKDAAKHTFSSYALNVVIIHFLQRVSPPVLPCLQDSESFGLSKEIFQGCEIQFARPSTDYIQRFRKNSMSLGELFVTFFDYFGEFDWKEHVVQIRSPAALFKTDNNWKRSIMAVQDPFELKTNVTRVIENRNALVILKAINNIRSEFRTENNIFLKDGFDFDLHSFRSLLPRTKNPALGVCFVCGTTGHLKACCPKVSRHV